jgi:hypothetical protein
MIDNAAGFGMLELGANHGAPVARVEMLKLGHDPNIAVVHNRHTIAKF